MAQEMLKVLTQGPAIEKSVLSSFTLSLKLHERIPIPFSQICVLRSWNLNQKYEISARNSQQLGEAALWNHIPQLSPTQKLFKTHRRSL